MSSPTTRHKTRYGNWLPADEQARVAFRARLADHTRPQTDRVLSPPVRALYDAIEDDPLLRMHLTMAIRQAHGRGYDPGYVDIAGLMLLIDAVMAYAPPFSTDAMVGCPINALLDWPMCMPSGFGFFQSPEVNEHLRAVLERWGRFLDSPGSRTYLNETDPTGWFSAEAGAYVDMSLFECRRDEPHYGFASWNDFFTRRLTPGARPVASPEDPSVVISACESQPFNLQRQAALVDRFWIKAQPYSLRDMFGAARQDLAESFVGGTVYQAFLSAYNYHRWHAPVAGTVVETYHIPGTYYAEAPSEGIDPAGPNNSQGFLTAVATRAVIVVDTGVKGLGRVAGLFVGMAEVSSCQVTVRPGQTVRKGDELGFFQFGGSTHCLIFEPGVALDFAPKPPFTGETPMVRVNAALARVRL